MEVDQKVKGPGRPRSKRAHEAMEEARRRGADSVWFSPGETIST